MTLMLESMTDITNATLAYTGDVEADSQLVCVTNALNNLDHVVSAVGSAEVKDITENPVPYDEDDYSNRVWDRAMFDEAVDTFKNNVEDIKAQIELATVIYK